MSLHERSSKSGRNKLGTGGTGDSVERQQHVLIFQWLRIRPSKRGCASLLYAIGPQAAPAAMALWAAPSACAGLLPRRNASWNALINAAVE